MGFFSGGWTPESSLKQTFKDVKAEGIDGVKKHLTKKALRDFNDVKAWADYPLVNVVTSALTGHSKETLFMDKIAEYEFSVEDVLKGREQTKAIVRFRHKDGASGTVEVDMVKEGTEWKIDSLNTPKYD